MFFKLENECDLYLKSGNENKVLGKTISVIVETFNKDQNDKKNSINITITFKVRLIYWSIDFNMSTLFGLFYA